MHPLNKMDTMCNRCKRHVSAYHAILMSNKAKLPQDKLAFSQKKLEHMKTFCIACATRECKFYMGLPPSKAKNNQGEECGRTLRRAERVKQYTREEQLGKRSAMMFDDTEPQTGVFRPEDFDNTRPSTRDLRLPGGFDDTEAKTRDLEGFDVIVELGQGAHGRVFYTLDEPNVIHKQQHDQRTCKEWMEEFTTQMAAYQGWEAFVTQGPPWAQEAGEFLRVTRPLAFTESQLSCEIAVERVCTPGAAALDHVMLGRPDFNYFLKGMGTIKGYKQMADLLGENFEQYVKAMGVFAGFMQYSLGFSGKDLEFVYATPCGSDLPPRIYVLDFGEAVQKVESAKVAEEGLGYIESYAFNNPEFWQSYLTTAKLFDSKDIADQVHQQLSEEDDLTVAN